MVNLRECSNPTNNAEMSAPVNVAEGGLPNIKVDISKFSGEAFNFMISLETCNRMCTPRLNFYFPASKPTG